VYPEGNKKQSTNELQETREQWPLILPILVKRDGEKEKGNFLSHHHTDGKLVVPAKLHEGLSDNIRAIALTESRSNSCEKIG
jgi:hypothetical protein